MATPESALSMSRRANAEAGVDFSRGTGRALAQRTVSAALGFTSDYHPLSDDDVLHSHPRGARWRKRRRGITPPRGAAHPRTADSNSAQPGPLCRHFKLPFPLQ